MKFTAAAALLALSLGLSLGARAQPLRFGADVPLANTRYGTAAGSPKLIAAGGELYAFWAAGTQVRMTRVLEGERRGGVAVLTLGSSDRVSASARDFDAVWSGTHFVIAAAYDSGAAIITKAVDRSAEPLTAPTLVASGGSNPSLAWNGRTVLLLYTTLDGSTINTRSLPLTPLGTPAAAAPELVTEGLYKAVASNGSAFAAVVARPLDAWVTTFDASGRMRAWASAGDLAASDPNLALASDGSDYLAVVSGETEVTAVRITATGATHPRVVIDQRASTIDRTSFLRPALAWNGSNWILTYTETHSGNVKPDLHVATLDREGVRLSRETSEGFTASTVATVGGRAVTAWWPGSNTLGVPLFAYLPPAASSPLELTHKAGEQTLLATATASDALLAVWRENLNNVNTLHAGVRSRTGEWRERQLDVNGDSVLAASDGSSFAIFVDTTALRFDQQLAPIGSPIKLPFQPQAAGSNGSSYALVSGRKGAVLSSAGVVGSTVTLTSSSDTLTWPTIASDGRNFLVAWGLNAICIELFCDEAEGVGAARFSPELHRLDATDLVFAASGNQAPYASWNGEHFTLIWSEAGKGIRRAVIPSGGTAEVSTLVPRTNLLPLNATAARNGTAVAVRQTDMPGFVTRVLLVDAAGRVEQSDPIDDGSDLLTVDPRVVVLADGRLGWLASRQLMTAPQHGSSHLTLAIDSAPPPPAAPQLAASLDARAVRLTWTAPAGAVTGYRVEYRVNDGSWNELERWLGPGERAATIRLNRAEDRASFRVRAWGEGGTSGYSNTAVVNVPRRRSVR